MSLSTSLHITFEAWLPDALRNPKYCEQIFLKHEPADENSLKIAASSVFKDEANNLVDLEKFAKFVAWLYNVRAMRPKVFSSIAAELLLARPAADLKAYLGALMIQKVGHVLILDGINVYGKILTRIDELAKQPTTILTPETKTLLAAIVGQHRMWSKNANEALA
jgi:hypothetical protein